MIFAEKSRLLGVAVVALICVSTGCGSSTTSLSPTGLAKCGVAVTPSQLAVDGGGGAGAVTISAAPECAWTASAAANWISGLAPSSGQGNGEIKFQVAANPAGTARQTDISLNAAIAKVMQAGAPCRIALTPTRTTVAFNGGDGTVEITTLSGCTWAVSSDASWLTAAPDDGMGPGAVRFSATANDGPARAGNLAIGDQIFVVTQPGVGGIPAPGPGPDPDPDPAPGPVPGPEPIPGPGPGPGPEPIPGPGPSPSPGTCAFSLQPATQSIDPAGGSVSVAVQTTDGCAWTAASNALWLTIGEASAGIGSGTVTVTASANAGASRTGTATIAGRTFTVNQGNGCTVSINRSDEHFSSLGGGGTPIGVSAAPGCAWTATTAARWITVTSGASGTGNGTVTYVVALNLGGAREATIVIGASTFTVSQGALLTLPLTQPAE